MDQLTATIIALNEEHRIGACLESLRGVADEIIVVDSYSTDRTVDICREYGCHVTQRRFDGFGTQRQYATSLATHRFILSIDADEVLSPALRESILRLKNEGFKHRVYTISRLNFYCGYPVKHCGWYPDYHIRLFDKRYANWNLHDVGEKVIFRDSVRPEPVDGDILHYRCDTREQYQAVTRSHATIKARVLAASPESISPLAPLLHGLKAWWKTFITEGGILEGNPGREIAAESYRSEYLAYSAAKKLNHQPR
ncbi:MAG: glycosyltransferase family 2 protein [Muribaculaceae bacterium]|nr:glycosyltransferase family 2 protein [Muribaculaceae bacterium]